MLARLEVAREQLTRALQAGDRAVLERLDPLLDERMPGVEDLRGLADTPAPFVPDATGRWIRALGVVAAVALVGGLGLPDLRNHLSDGALCRAIGPWSTRAQHDWYLRVGARCRDRVRQEDIPAAAFERARRADTRGAYRGFKSFPTNSLHVAQADEAVRNLAHRAMEEARAKGTLAAVLRCRATHSVWRDPPLRAEADRALDLAYEGAAARLAAQGLPQETAGFLAGLLDWFRRHHTLALEVYVPQPSTEALRQVEARLGQAGRGEVDGRLPGLAEAAAGYEPYEEILSGVRAGLRAVLAGEEPDLIPRSLRLGAKSGRFQPAGLRTQVPALVVETRIVPTDATYPLGTSGRSCVGVAISYRLTFRIPAGRPPWQIDFTARPERSPDFSSPLAGVSRSGAYHTLLAWAFSDTGRALLARLREGGAVSRPADDGAPEGRSGEGPPP